MLHGARGNIYWRDQAITSTKLGFVIKRDVHNFDHETIWMWGWVLVIGDTVDGRRIITQNAALTYNREPTEPVPYHYPDRDALEDSTYLFLPPGETAPEGMVEIPYKPHGYHCTILATTKHSFLALGVDPRMKADIWSKPELGAMGVCAYAHRNPQDGDVVQEFNGWGDAYV
jgi:hypothetical protein